MSGKDVRGRRIGAAFIDLFLYWALSFGLFFLMADSTQGAVFLDDVNTHVTLGDKTWYLEGSDVGLLWLSDLGVALIWFGLLPGLTGWTPGKLMTGLRVVRGDGRLAGLGRNLARPFLWIADGFPYILPGLVGFILILATKEHRRVADFAAGTYVVASDEVGRAPTAAALPGGPAAPPVPATAGGPPPNWYADPGGAPQMRWWDGMRWTDHTRPPPPG
jgi:uncharacterized RDD family membrane protein YckC